MKKGSLSLIILIFCSLAARAQDNPFFIGGSIGFQNVGTETKTGSGSYSSNTETSGSVYRIMPSLGMELSSNWHLGISLNYVLESTTNKVNDKDVDTEISQWGVGLFARYVFNPDDKLNFFMSPAFNYAAGDIMHTVSEYTGDEKADYSAFNVGISAGLFYNISDSFRLYTSMGFLNYTSVTIELDEYENTSNVFGLNFNLSEIMIGAELRF